MYPDHGTNGAGGARRRRRRALRGQGGRARRLPTWRARPGPDAVRGRRARSPYRRARARPKTAFRVRRRRVNRGTATAAESRRIVSRHVGGDRDQHDPTTHRATAGGEGGHPGRRSCHPIPAGDQGRAQGAAAGRRPAGAAVHRRGGRRRRHQRRPADHRPRQDVDGGPLRPAALPGEHGWRRRATWSGWPRSAGPPSSPRSTPAARASRSASGTRSSCAESHVGDDDPFAVLLGDEFVDPAEPLLPSMLDLQARTGGIVLAFMEVPPDETIAVRHRLGRAGRRRPGGERHRSAPSSRQGDRPGREAVAGGGAEQPRGAGPLRPAGRTSSRRSSAPSPAAAARSS